MEQKSWNDVFVQNLFNASSYTDGNFHLPEGFGRDENYTRVITMLRKINVSKHPYQIELLCFDGGWSAKNVEDETRVLGSTPEGVIDLLITITKQTG